MITMDDTGRDPPHAGYSLSAAQDVGAAQYLVAWQDYQARYEVFMQYLQECFELRDQLAEESGEDEEDETTGLRPDDYPEWALKMQAVLEEVDRLKDEHDRLTRWAQVIIGRLSTPPIP